MRVYFVNANTAFLPYAHWWNISVMFRQFQIRLLSFILLKAPRPLPHQGACNMKDLSLFQREKRILLQV